MTIKTVGDLRTKFPRTVKFEFFNTEGERLDNAMSSDKIAAWWVNDNFSVVVVLK